MAGKLAGSLRRLFVCAGLVLASVGAAAPTWAQDDGFIAPIEDPIEDGSAGGGSIEGGGGDTAVSYYSSPRLMYAMTSSLVRAGPGTGYAQIATIPYGGQVTVLGSAAAGAWLYLQMDNGARGFTASNLLSSSRPAASSGSGPSETLACQPGEVVIRMSDGTSICARLQ